MVPESVCEWSDKIRGELDKVGVVGGVGERNRPVVEKGRHCSDTARIQRVGAFGRDSHPVSGNHISNLIVIIGSLKRGHGVIGIQFPFCHVKAGVGRQWKWHGETSLKI